MKCSCGVEFEAQKVGRVDSPLSTKTSFLDEPTSEDSKIDPDSNVRSFAQGLGRKKLVWI